MPTDRRPAELPRFDPKEVGLVDYMGRISPRLAPPYHFAPITEAYEKHSRDGESYVISAPVQHGKTTLMTHAIPWWLARDPSLSIVYISNADRFAQRQSRTMRRRALESGVRLMDDHNTIAEWRTDQEGGLLATSVGGELTGHPASIICMDDLIKNREQAESADYRQTVWDFVTDVVYTRVGPKTSIFLQGSRWHDDDPSGRALRAGYHHIHLKAISDEGYALCPDGPDPREPRDLAFLNKQRARVGEYGWASLYQGEPKPKNASLFGSAHYYQLAPVHGFRILIGVDLAYAGKKRSDWSSAVVIACVGDWYYVLDVYHSHEKIGVVRNELREFRDKWGGAQMVSYAGTGADRGPFDLLAEQGLVIECMTPTMSEELRATETAIAWNKGKILLPLSAPWLNVFKNEVTTFTGGPGDATTDQVAALVSGFDGLKTTAFDTGGVGFFHGRRVV